MKYYRTLLLLLVVAMLWVALFAGCGDKNENENVRLLPDQRKQLQSLRLKHSDEEISGWSGDRLLREMKAVIAVEKSTWDDLPTLKYSDMLDMSADEAGQEALTGYLENLPVGLRYTTTNAEKAFIVQEAGPRLLYVLDATIRNNPALQRADEDEITAEMSAAVRPISDMLGDEILTRFRLPSRPATDDAI